MKIELNERLSATLYAILEAMKEEGVSDLHQLGEAMKAIGAQLFQLHKDASAIIGTPMPDDQARRLQTVCDIMHADPALIPLVLLVLGEELLDHRRSESDEPVDLGF